jgi:hypothetical protein
LTAKRSPTEIGRSTTNNSLDYERGGESPRLATIFSCKRAQLPRRARSKRHREL